MPVLAELAGDEGSESCRTFILENEDHTLAGQLKAHERSMCLRELWKIPLKFVITSLKNFRRVD
uniref:CSON014796 protein n=1 Tax=Culicoides sonorensis TaxID=179676 RepID=A0A336K2Y8_CULSO